MKKKLFDDLIATTHQAVAHSHGENVYAKEYRVKAPDQVNVRAIRDKLNMTQDKFADTFDFTVSAVKKWESGARTPEGPARMLLHMIAKDYKTVLRLAK